MGGGILYMPLHADAVRQSDPHYRRIAEANQAAVAKAVEEARKREAR